MLAHHLCGWKEEDYFRKLHIHSLLSKYSTSENKTAFNEDIQHNTNHLLFLWIHKEIQSKEIQTLRYQPSVQSPSCVQLFVTPWTAARQASLSINNSQSLLKLMSFESVMPSNHLILCHPLILLHSIFPRSRVFSNESVHHVRWPKYCSFSFSICPSNEYSGLISFTTYLFDLPAVQGTLKRVPQHHRSKASILWHSALFMVQLSYPYMTTGKTIDHWIIEKEREFQKNIYFCFIEYAKAFDCVDHNNLWNTLNERNTRPPDLLPKKTVCRSRSNVCLEAMSVWKQTWNNRLVPNWERSMSRLYIVTMLI